MNIQYMILLHELLPRGQYDLTSYITSRLHIQNGDTISEDALLQLLTSVMSSSVSLSPTTLARNFKNKVNSHSAFANEILRLIKSIRKTGYKPDGALYALLVRRLCNAKVPLPFAPSLAEYNGEGYLPPPTELVSSLQNVSLLVSMADEDGRGGNQAFQAEVLAAYLSREDCKLQGVEYFFQKKLLREVAGQELNPELRQIYETAVSRDDSLRLEEPEDTTRIRLQSRLLMRSVDEGSSKELYVRVLETLLHARRSSDAQTLLQLMLTKNISTTFEDVGVLMGHEMKAGNNAGAVEIFSAFFHLPNSSAPDVRSVSLLAIALSKVKDSDEGPALAAELLPHVLKNKMQLSPQVCETFCALSLLKKDTLTAAEYTLMIPPLQRKVSSLSEVVKLCSLGGHVDVLNRLKCEHVFPLEIISHYIAGYALKGMWKRAFNCEYVLRKTSEHRGVVAPRWVETFLLFAAATGVKRENAALVLENTKSGGSELNYNLAVYTGLKHVYLNANYDDASEIAKERRIGEVVARLHIMLERHYRLHRSIFILGEALDKSGRNVTELTEVLRSFQTCDCPSASPYEMSPPPISAAATNTSLQSTVAGYTDEELEGLRLMDSPLLNVAVKVYSAAI